MTRIKTIEVMLYKRVEGHLYVHFLAYNGLLIRTESVAIVCAKNLLTAFTF